MSNASSNGRPIFEGESERLEQILSEFESAWSSGQKPDLGGYLNAADVEPRTLLTELVHADLEYRLKAGEPIRVECYLAKYAELAADRQAALRLIQAEFDLRRRREPGLRLDEYLDRFPQYRADLPERLRGPHAAISELPRPSDATFVGKFELLERVGEGAFGTVYRARDTQLDRIVAVKLPRADRSLTAEDAEKFQREARNAAQLSHPSIVPIYEVGHDAAVPYIVSAYIEGLTLADALVRQHLDYKQIASVVFQVADGLDHAHRHGVVHRDLKPSNIMLGRIQGVGNRSSDSVRPESRLPIPDSRLPATQAFVMDFGLARRDDGDSRLTVEGMIFGTPAYMSPEQARGENNRVDGRSDMYALGVILYELMTGEVPFRGAARMVLQQIINEEPRPPRRLDDKIPRDMETIALKCMAKEQSRRYSTAGALAADLGRYLDGVPILARPVGRLERGWRWAKRKPLVAGLSALVAVLFLVGAVGGTVASIIIYAKKNEAELSRDSARDRLQLALDTIYKELNLMQEQMEDQPALYPLRERLVREAVDGLQQVAVTTPVGTVDRGMSTAHERLGDIFLMVGRAQEAREQYEQFLAIVEGLSTSSAPSGVRRLAPAVARAKLGEACLQMGDVPAAASYCRQAVVAAEDEFLKNQKSTSDARDLAECRERLGKVELQQGNVPAAVESFQRAVEVTRQIVDRLPDNMEAKNDLAGAYLTLGDAQVKLQSFAEAKNAYVQSSKHYQDVVKARVGTARARRNLAVSYAKLGDMALRTRDSTAAEQAYRSSQALYEELASSAPKNSIAQVELSIAYGRLGDLYDGKKDPIKAREFLQKALPPIDAFAAAYPQNSRVKHDRAVVYFRLACVNLFYGYDADARDCRAKALTDFEEVAKHSTKDGMALFDLATAHGAFGKLEMNKKDYVAAMADFQSGESYFRRLEADGKLRGNPAWGQMLQEQVKNLALCRRFIALSLWPRLAYLAQTAK
jgi:serine/threonine protein kinase